MLVIDLSNQNYRNSDRLQLIKILEELPFVKRNYVEALGKNFFLPKTPNR